LRVFVVVAVTLCPFVYGSTEHSLEEKEAVELAYAALDSQRGAKAEDTELVHVARFNWPSSAIGCPKPGLQYTQAIVPGFLVLLRHGNRQYRVHIGRGRAVICDFPRAPLNLADVLLDNVKKMAKQDLADRLGVPITEINIAEVRPMVWPDTNFGCQASETERVAKTIRGHLIKLDYNSRIYEYRTSRTAALPCPPIESE
tara:strand:- start:2637 stop:3236 length:600 start_codon:yes stop_codon:yes gene_type:complete